MASDPDKDIKKSVDGFIKGMNKELETMRKQLEKEGKKKVPVITIVHNNNKASYSRTVEEQVKFLLKNSSWTFTSRHLSGAARHVLVKIDGKVRWDVNKASGWAPYDFPKVKQAWVKCMKSSGLRNYKDKEAWGAGDELHFQLPDSKPKLTDEKVKKVILLYMKATRTHGKKKNEKLERDFKAVIEAYEKKLKLADKK